MKNGLIISYRGLGEPRFASKALGIVQGLTGNAHFPLPWPSEFPQQAALSAAQVAHARLVTEAADGDRGKIAARRAKRAELEGMIRRLAPYLLQVAKGNRAVLESTGYDLTKAVRERAPLIPDAPEQVRLKRGAMPGELLVSVVKPRGAGSLMLAVSTSNPALAEGWRVVAQAGSMRNFSLKGLQRGVDHAVRARAIGAKGPGPWSAFAVLMPV